MARRSVPRARFITKGRSFKEFVERAPRGSRVERPPGKESRRSFKVEDLGQGPSPDISSWIVVLGVLGLSLLPIFAPRHSGPRGGDVDLEPLPQLPEEPVKQETFF
jgi:hypothetical protein